MWQKYRDKKNSHIKSHVFFVASKKKRVDKKCKKMSRHSGGLLFCVKTLRERERERERLRLWLGVLVDKKNKTKNSKKTRLKKFLVREHARARFMVVEVEMEETRRTVPDAKTMFSLCNDGRIKETLKETFDWKAYERGRLVSPTDCNLIVKYEETSRGDGGDGASSSSPSLKTQQLMESSDGKLIANAFLDVFRNVSRREAVERALANVCKMLGDPQLAKVSSEYFLPETNKTVTLSNIDAYKALTRLMVNAKNGWFVREKASFILGVLLSKSESLRNESFLSGEEEEEGEEQRCSEEMQTARIVARWSIDLLGGGDGSLADTTFISGDGVGGTMTIQGGGRDENQEHNEDRVIPTAIHALASVLQHRKTRPLVRNLGAYKLIAPLLDSEKVNPNCRVQVLYEAALCAWLLSFDAKARKQALKVDNAIVVRNLIKVAKTATKEKVVRVAIMALKNILIGSADSGTDDAKKASTTSSTVGEEAEQNSNKENVAAHGKRDENDEKDDELGPIAETCIERESLQKVCENLSHRGFEDAELLDNLEQLAKGLAKRRVIASSWERYHTEVRSGSLDWSPSHTDEGFWRNECSKLTDNNCFVLRNLIAMMSSRDVDPRTLAVACHDVGEFATHYPAGRFLACDLGAKTAAMALMVHEDEEVKAKSLVCVQKLLVANWKFISGDN